ncbi:MAG: c-type cytochrome biogenesis protein CcmI, partial [Gallionella sp.]
MTLFWILAASLLLIAIAFVVIPLWRKNTGNNAVLRDAANLEILRDQSAEMSADLAHGLLNEESFVQGQRELQARLLEEVKPSEAVPAAPRNPAKVLALVLAVLLPLSSLLLYLKLGNSKVLMPQPAELSVA